MKIIDFERQFSWDLTKEIIVNCECYSEECLIRNVIIYDFIQDIYISKKMCNSIVKLYFDNVPIEINENYHYSNLIELIIDKYYVSNYNISLESNNRDNVEIHNKVLLFELSYRPFVFKGINLELALQTILNMESLVAKQSLINLVKQTVKNYFNQNDFKKNKTLKKNILSQLNRLKFYDQQLDSDLLEIFNNILLLILKNK